MAKGFQKPVSGNPDEILIPPEHWRFMQFTDSYQGAAGQGKSYTGIVIARRH
jgi:hypothetical protein